MDRAKKKHVFQIRKVPLKRFVPQKTPELYALDVHSICLPVRKKKSLNWASLHYQEHNQFQQEFNEQIIYSQAYQELYGKYLRMREDMNKEKSQIQNQIDKIEQEIDGQKTQKRRLTGMRDGLYTQIQTLRDNLTQIRDNNYNLRWQLYPQRGTYLANLQGYSFLEPNQMTYQELLQMEEQMGTINRGLTLNQIAKIETKVYECQSPEQKQICCVCYDEIAEGEMVTVLKCKHLHHCDCIKDWLLKQKNCPICKKQVVIDQYSLEQ